MTVNTYTLTEDEAAIYDSGDDRLTDAQSHELAERFKGQNVDILHPEGFVAFMFEA